MCLSSSACYLLVSMGEVPIQNGTKLGTDSMFNTLVFWCMSLLGVVCTACTPFCHSKYSSCPVYLYMFGHHLPSVLHSHSGHPSAALASSFRKASYANTPVIKVPQRPAFCMIGRVGVLLAPSSSCLSPVLMSIQTDVGCVCLCWCLCSSHVASCLSSLSHCL